MNIPRNLQRPWTSGGRKWKIFKCDNQLTSIIVWFARSSHGNIQFVDSWLSLKDCANFSTKCLGLIRKVSHTHSIFWGVWALLGWPVGCLFNTLAILWKFLIQFKIVLQFGTGFHKAILKCFWNSRCTCITESLFGSSVYCKWTQLLRPVWHVY